MGTEGLWPMLLGFTVLPAIVQCIGLIFCPESPRFLLINKMEEEKAQAGKNLSQKGRAVSWLPACTELEWEARTDPGAWGGLGCNSQRASGLAYLSHSLGCTSARKHEKPGIPT